MSAANTRMEAAEAMDMARAVAGEAALLLRHAAGTARHVETKTNSRDPVTEWDMRTEELIRERLAALTPDIPLLCEESGAVPAPSARQGEGEGEGAGHESHAPGEYQWLIDPIDGTVNFMHGLPLFCVSIALEHRGEPIAGAVYAPALSWQFYGHAGGGAFLDGERMTVSQVSTLDRALLTSGFPYDRATNPLNNFAEWEHLQRNAGACRRLGAAALDLCMVAAGWFDGYWERHLHAWDVSAGALFVIEAGGMLSSMDGSAFGSAKGEVVASNGVIHRELLKELGLVRRAT